MNVHHLELFYYVATHRGISAAVRAMPYGIQQPAVSSQIGKLEQELGVKLFSRSPFRLTEPGEKLFAHVQPFFEILPDLATQLKGADLPELRIGGAELVLRDHLPLVMKGLRKHYPKLKFSMRSTGFQSQIEEWVNEGQVDVAFAPVYPRAPAGLRTTRIAQLPLVLEVNKGSKIKSAESLWKQGTIEEPLICLSEDTGIVREFFRTLKNRGVSWPHIIETTSLDLVKRYVANGDGIGLNVLVDPKASSREIKTLCLDDFTPVTMGAIWRGEPSELVKKVIAEVRVYARSRWPDWICEE